MKSLPKKGCLKRINQEWKYVTEPVESAKR